MAWTSQEVFKFVKSMLGAPKRVVELDESNLKEALKRSVAQLATIKPIYKYGFLNIAEGPQGYNFTTLGKPFGKGVTDVYDQPITSPASVFTEFEWYKLRVPPYIDMTEVVMDKLYYKELGHITGTQFDWHWDPDTTILLVAPVPTRARRIAYQYNDSITEIQEARPVDQGWIVDYTLALAKEMLGRVRNKFQGVPGNDLPVDTDGADLISEGQTEQEALKEALWGKRGDWTPPIVG